MKENEEKDRRESELRRRVTPVGGAMMTSCEVSSICRSTPPLPQSRCAQPTWRGRVERRKEAAAARVLGAAQDAGVGTRRGGEEQREDVAAARVSGAIKRRCQSEAVGVDAGTRRGEKGDRDREVRAGCGAAWEWGDFWKVAKFSLGVYTKHVCYSGRMSWTAG